MRLESRLTFDDDGIAAWRRLSLRSAVSFFTGGRLFFAGNGGSAANANHAAEDFQLTAGLHAISLAANVAAITAIANDYGYDSVFSRQLLSARPGPKDTLVALSVSGTSPNICRVLQTAQEAGMCCWLLTGPDFPGEIRQEYPCHVVQFKGHIGAVESAHLHFLHEVLQRVDQLLELIGKDCDES